MPCGGGGGAGAARSVGCATPPCCCCCCCRNGESNSLAEQVDASRIGLEMSGRAVEPGLNGGSAGAKATNVGGATTAGGAFGGDCGCGIGGALRCGTTSAGSVAGGAFTTTGCT